MFDDSSQKVACICDLCPRHCHIKDGERGFCGARIVVQGTVVLAEPGRISGLALDPIEKKPLKRFYSGSNILSLGFWGCNMLCPYCQNHEISHPSLQDPVRSLRVLSTQQVVELAKSLILRGNIGVAYTYNEPLTSYEYVLETAREVQAHGMKNVVVTNGCFELWVIEALVPYTDAWNIDLKSFQPQVYAALGGDLLTVQRSIELVARKKHVEVTALIVSGQNDGEEEMQQLSRWLAGVDKSIPLHINRSFPHWLRPDLVPPSVEKLTRLVNIARESLEFVYPGNFSLPFGRS